MGARAGIAIFLSILWIGCPGVGGAAAQPDYRNAVFQPSFFTDGKRYVSGKGFVTVYGGRHLFITANHLIGVAGGYDRNHDGEEIAETVDRMEAVSIDDDAVRLATTRVLTLPDTEARGFFRTNGDVVAFIVEPAGDYMTLPLATALPREGEELWMLSPAWGAGGKAHKVTVKDADDDSILYVFQSTTINLTATSGAPLVNADGEVVGINIGGGRRGGAMLGVGNPAVAIRAHLDNGRPE